MRRFLFYVIIIFGGFAFSVSSCHKNGLIEAGVLAGYYVWQRSEGGIAGNTVVTSSASSQVIVSFGQDKQWQALLNSTVVMHGSYYTTAVPGGKIIHFDKAIQAENLNLCKEQRITTNNTNGLQLHDEGLTDGFSHQFTYTPSMDLIEKDKAYWQRTSC